MARGGRAGGKGFHEGPLVLFTALATMGGGVGAAWLLGIVVGAAGPAFPRPAAFLLSALFGAALLASLGHLGRPFRGPLALRRLGRSPLSREVAAVGAVVGGGVVAAALPMGSPWAGWVGGFVVVASLAALLSIGLVYRLPHQFAWRGAAVFQPLAQGTLWGWVALLGVPRLAPALAPDLVPAAVVGILLVADATLFLLRIPGRRGAPASAAATHPELLRFRRSIVGARLALGSALPAALLLLGAGGWALLSLSLGVVLDRLAFYGLGLRWSTEGEVARVEAFL